MLGMLRRVEVIKRVKALWVIQRQDFGMQMEVEEGGQARPGKILADPLGFIRDGIRADQEILVARVIHG